MLNNIHDACILVNSFFDSIAHIFQNIYYLETIFFRLLYASTDNIGKGKSLIHFEPEVFSTLQIECNGEDLKQFQQNIAQEGQNHKIVYFWIDEDGKKRIKLFKKYNVLKHQHKEGQMQITFYIKEVEYVQNFNDQEEELSSIQYELNFIVKLLDNSIMVYFKIELHPINQIISPFNREFRNELHERIYSTSKGANFRCNFESIETVIINSTSEVLFKILSNPQTYNGSESFVDIEKNKGDLKKGDHFIINMKLMGVKLEFEVTEIRFQQGVGSDSIFSCKLFSSVPEHVKFTFTFTIKPIKHNMQFLVFHNLFEEALQPDFMKKHSITKRNTLISFKTHAESVINNI